jgi:uncharacterized HAD superfamily protein/adenine/guanine phosphoribosyltransferase-like PRPP-binding protein
LQFRSYADLATAISKNLQKVPRDIDLVVGIPRSGLLAANIVSLELNLPLTDVEGLLSGEIFRSGITRRKESWLANAFASRHALVLDDSIFSGITMAKERERICEARLRTRVTYAAVFAAPKAKKKVDLFFDVCPMPRVFAWNYLDHSALLNSCVDLDGVLCCDPTEKENDDGPAYQKFLRTTRVLRVPSNEIGWIVTSRLERYRPQTEAWLATHGIKYRRLVMLNGYDAASRRRLNVHSRFKASVYSKVDADLFIESNPDQAQEIARISGKPVVCSETHELARPEAISRARAKQSVILPIRRALRCVNRLRHRLKMCAGAPVSKN